MNASHTHEGGNEPQPKGFTRVPPDDRRCTGVGKDGERCKGWAMREHAQQLCGGHAGVGVAASPEAARAAQAKGAQRRSEDAEKPVRSAKQVYRQAVESAAQEFVDIRLAIARDTGASDGDRLRAMEQLETRAMGRPTEHIEVETKVPQSEAELAAMTVEERAAFIREATRRIEEQRRTA